MSEEAAGSANPESSAPARPRSLAQTGDPRPSAALRAKRGRPSVIDRDAIGAVAFRIWHDRGFAATSWQHIADASGVSVRTLSRHFGSQAELVSTGVDAAIERMHRSLDAADAAAPVDEVLREAVLRAVAGDGGEGFPLIWQRVLAREPELRTAFARVGSGWTRAFAEEIGRRWPGIPAAACNAIAAALHGAAASALLDWAEAGGGGSPVHAVREALRWIRVEAESARPETHR